MPSNFADLVYARERIKVGLMRVKFDYVSPIGASSRRTRIAGAKKKEGDDHTVTSTPAWPKPLNTPHGTHQYAQHHLSFSARAEASSDTALTHRGELFRLRLRLGLTRPTTLTLTQTRRGTFHLDPNDIWGTLAIFHHQPIGRGGPGKDHLVSIPKMV